jgi:hypothetical protein
MDPITPSVLVNHYNAITPLIARPLPARGELARQTAGMGRQLLRRGMDSIADLIDERTQADTGKGLT